MRVNLWLVRHCAPEWPGGLALGHGDPSLSWAGKRQAASLARAFAPLSLEAVISSDLRRAAQTATSIASSHRVAVQIWPELREVNFGVWEGRQLGRLWVEDPEAARRWEVDPTDFPGDFGETFPAVHQRLAVAASRLLRMRPAPILVVGHGGTLRLLRAILERTPLSQAWREAMPLGAVLQVAWSDLGDAPVLDAGGD